MKKSDITFIAPEETELEIDSVTFTIRPISMRLLPSLLTCVEPAFGEIEMLMADPSIKTAADALARQSRPLCEAVAICTQTDVDKILDMTPDRAAGLLLVCCEVNADFFSRAVQSLQAQAGTAAPQLSERMKGLIARLPKPSANGDSPSSSSPALATATTTP